MLHTDGFTHFSILSDTGQAPNLAYSADLSQAESQSPLNGSKLQNAAVAAMNAGVAKLKDFTFSTKRKPENEGIREDQRSTKAVHHKDEEKAISTQPSSVGNTSTSSSSSAMDERPDRPSNSRGFR